MYFVDRREAGKRLAEALEEYADNCVVFALPRGGVETAVEVAHALEAPLDIVIARKIGHPSNPEYAIGAVTESGPAVWNEVEKHLPYSTWLNQAEANERAEAARRRKHYLEDHHQVSAKGKTAIIIDDGIATGLTILATIGEVAKQKPDKIIVAVPCAPREAIDEIIEETEDVIVLNEPDEYLGAVGAYYDNFPQLTDDDVSDLLEEAEH